MGPFNHNSLVRLTRAPPLIYLLDLSSPSSVSVPSVFPALCICFWNPSHHLEQHSALRRRKATWDSKWQKDSPHEHRACSVPQFSGDWSYSPQWLKLAGCSKLLCLLLHIFQSKYWFLKVSNITKERERQKTNISLSTTQMNKKYVTLTGEISEESFPGPFIPSPSPQSPKQFQIWYHHPQAFLYISSTRVCVTQPCKMLMACF